MALITLVIFINSSCFIFGKSWVAGFSNVLSLNVCHFTSCEILVLSELDQLIFVEYMSKQLR